MLHPLTRGLTIHCLCNSHLALAVYDYLLTLPDEWALVWRRPCREWGSSTWLFLVNRIFMLITIITYIAPYSEKVCFI